MAMSFHRVMLSQPSGCVREVYENRQANFPRLQREFVLIKIEDLIICCDAIKRNDFGYLCVELVVEKTERESIT